MMVDYFLLVVGGSSSSRQCCCRREIFFRNIELNKSSNKLFEYKVTVLLIKRAPVVTKIGDGEDLLLGARSCAPRECPLDFFRLIRLGKYLV